MINGERCYEYDEITEDKLVDFSEGSKSLYELLKYCHDNHIITNACCKGHEDGKSNPNPYISFKVTSPNQMAQLINNLMNSPLSSQIECTYGSTEGILTIYCDDVMFRDIFFELIVQSFKMYNKDLDSNYSIIYDLYNIYHAKSKFGINIVVRYDHIVIEKQDYAYYHFEGDKLIRTATRVDNCFGMLEQVGKKRYVTDNTLEDNLGNETVNDQELFGEEIVLPCSIIINNEDIISFYDKAKQSVHHKQF